MVEGMYTDGPSVCFGLLSHTDAFIICHCTTVQCHLSSSARLPEIIGLPILLTLSTGSLRLLLFIRAFSRSYKLTSRWHSKTEPKEGGHDRRFRLDQNSPTTASISTQKTHQASAASSVASSISIFPLRYNGKLKQTSDQFSASGSFSRYF